MLAVLGTDGVTPTPVTIAPATHALGVDDDTTGSDNGPADAVKDGNYVSSLMAVSSADGVTPVVLYTDADGKLLIDST